MHLMTCTMSDDINEDNDSFDDNDNDDDDVGNESVQHLGGFAMIILMLTTIIVMTMR